VIGSRLAKQVVRTHEALSVLSKITALVPVDLAVAGPRRDRVFRVFDSLFGSLLRKDTLSTPFGPMKVHWDHPPERLLSYLFHNVLRFYEKSELGLYLEEHAEPGATFLDIGANLGMYSLVARRLGFKTVAIEPEPRHSAFLKRNADIYGDVLDVALSDAPGALPLYYNPENPGATSLFPDPTYVKGDESVPVRTFSTLAAEGAFGDVSKIRIIKIDVEGFEAHVVEGMRSFLTAEHKPHIWCEVRGDRSGRNGGNYRRVHEILSGFGYQMKDTENRQIVSVDDDHLANQAVFDLLFTPPQSSP